MDKRDQGATEEKKQSFLGMRIIKTVVSIYLSIMITVLMGGIPLNAAISSLLTTQDSRKGSRTYGKNRLIGTLVGASFSLFFVFLVDKFSIALFTPWYYLVMTLLLIPIIKVNLWLNIAGAASSACIVFLISLMAYVEQADIKYIYVIHRIIDTFVGVGVAILVNHYLPHHGEDAK